MKKITKAEYSRRGKKAAATKAANKLAVSRVTVTENGVTKIASKKKTVLTAEDIKAANKAFNKLTVKQKRVAVAKDVIEQIEKGNYIPKNMGYITGWDALDSTEDVQQLALTNKLPKCTVCGLGACIVSVARLGDTLDVGDIRKVQYSPEFAEKATNKLVSIFGSNMVSMIETAFEGDKERHYPWSTAIHDNNHSYAARIPNIEAASMYHGEYSSPKKRLIAIMENIIKNKGKFIPEFSTGQI